jgi:hypothetical protein
MNPISTIELAKIRADAYRAVFDKVCTIRREDQEFDSKGGSPDNLIDIADNVPCAMVGLSMPNQQLLAGQDVGISSRTLHTPFGTDIKTDDMVTINGIDYKVLSPSGEKTIQIFTSVVILRKTPL